jgi:zinc D-Ala-D-Ala carboxypeptidase
MKGINPSVWAERVVAVLIVGTSLAALLLRDMAETQAAPSTLAARPLQHSLHTLTDVSPGPLQIGLPARASVGTLFDSLDISPQIVKSRGLKFYNEERRLIVVEVGEDGRQHQLTPEASAAWSSLRESALSAGVTLRIESAYRSVMYQAELVQQKLDRGMSIDEALTINAPPGYSEHHTGRVVDISTPGAPTLETEFEETDAFRWLEANAASFGFVMTLPRGNRYGYRYEPWHWCFVGAGGEC